MKSEEFKIIQKVLNEQVVPGLNELMNKASRSEEMKALKLGAARRAIVMSDQLCLACAEEVLRIIRKSVNVGKEVETIDSFAKSITQRIGKAAEEAKKGVRDEK